MPISPAAQAANPTVVSLTFNDGFTSQYDYARPVLRQYGVPATFYVSSNWVDNKAKGYMASWQLDGLYRDGNEIGGMGRDHKSLTATYFSDPAADLAYKRDQVCGDRQRLAELGYDPWTFAYPQGATNATAQGIVSNCGYLSGRISGGLSTTASPYAEPIPPANAYALRTANGPAGAITLTQLQNAVTAAATHAGGWLPIAFNQVCHQGDPTYSTCMGTTKPIDDAVLAAFLSWLRTQPDVSVKTVRNVMGAPAQPPLPPRPTLVSLTFDDGLKSQVRAADDILDARDVHGTFFVNSGPIDRQESGTMTWDQVAALRDDGHEIGGHTLDHVSIKGMPYNEAYHQVCDDRARLIQMGF